MTTMPDPFSEYYQDCLEDTYDCVDRIVLNAYFIMGQSGGGFRTWWRCLEGHEDHLDDTHLMRFAGRFSRRVHAYAQKNRIPLIQCERGERKHEIAESYLPKDPSFQGVFCILAGRAPASVWTVQKGVHLEKKDPQPYVNHYSFHILDPEWGHMTIKLCPHPPFNAQIILNGHEYVARQAKREGIAFQQEGNCFTQFSDGAGLAGIADTMRAESSVGRLATLCDRWIYTACLCFALDMAEQKRSGFSYSYSVYQAEYSRNLLFQKGRLLEDVFQGVIDRTRRSLHIRRVATLFGSKNRPCHRKMTENSERYAVTIERPVYDLTVFKVHFGKLTAKIYSKGERVLRIEAIAHNTAALHCGKVIERFPQIVEALKEIVERFLGVLQSVDISFIDDQKLDTWHLPSQVGAARVGGIDINKSRIRTMMEAVIALASHPNGFCVSEAVEKVKEIRNHFSQDYQARQAAYDLKKFRGKGLIEKISHSRRYRVPLESLRAMVAFLTLREKVLKPLLSHNGRIKRGPKPQPQWEGDIHYHNIQREMQQLFKLVGIAA